MEHPAGELAAGRAVLEHQLFALVVRQLEPVLALVPALGHGIETPSGLVVGGELGVEPALLHLVGDAGGVFADLGERDIGVDHIQPGGLDVGLEPSKPPEIGPQGHERAVGLVTQDHHGDHLVTRALGLLHRGDDGLAVGRRARPTEQVQHTEADLRAESIHHG